LRRRIVSRGVAVLESPSSAPSLHSFLPFFAPLEFFLILCDGSDPVLSRNTQKIQWEFALSLREKYAPRNYRTKPECSFGRFGQVWSPTPLRRLPRTVTHFPA
jgi:hypothetical protein